MTYQQVQNQILSLPQSFQRFGSLFIGIINAFSAALALGTNAADYTLANLNFQNAQWGWLDTFGLLFGLPRNQYESDPAYKQRLAGTLIAPHGTPLAIIQFILFALGITATISENFANCSYQLNFSQILTNAQLTQVIETIAWVRPAGIPFLPLYQVTGGLFLNTINYFSVKRVSGSYLVKSQTEVVTNLAPNTNNTPAMLPTIYIKDLYLTGQITP